MVGGMTQWSPQQENALKKVDDWYKNHRREQQTFYLAGFAGTGKTTLAKHFAQGVQGHVKFATFTGKAAHVMESKGCEGATTIHRLIYRPKINSKNHLRVLQKQLADFESAPIKNLEAIKRIREELQREQENAGRMSFSLNLESDLRFAKLLIVDEISMVNKEMGADLESFGIPILVLGDPEQLPPVFGAGYFTEKSPDIMLDEIHRQALDNPIIKLSQLVRNGDSLPFGTYGTSRVINEKLEPKDVLKHDIILTGLRKTKRACDNRSRTLLGFTSPFPQQGDKLMCVKNNHAMELLNGQMWEAVHDGVSIGDGSISIHIKNENDQEMAVAASEKLFRGIPLERFEHEEDVQEFEYAYAITVHKSQGSQWDNVLLFDEKNAFANYSKRDRQRWLYTGITRAAERVTVMRL